MGTKLLVARDCADYRGIGQDLVAMNVNDLLPRGGASAVLPRLHRRRGAGVGPAGRDRRRHAGGLSAGGLRAARGETAELPDAYRPGDCDLAGFAVGLVDRACVPRGGLCAGDLILGYPSNGIHANGLSLARKILSAAGLRYADHVPEFAPSIGAELLRPTRLYVDPVLRLMSQVPIKAAAHVTGGLCDERWGCARKGCGCGSIPTPTLARRSFAARSAGWCRRGRARRDLQPGAGLSAGGWARAAAALTPFLDGDLRVVGEVRAGQRGVELGYAAI